MRRSCLFATTAMSGALVLNTGFLSPAAGQDGRDALVKRGEMLATIGDCDACHSREGGDKLAGGYAFETKFGTLYSANITPNEEHGIGTWTLEDFKRAMRQGVRKDGAYIYPAMPYYWYTKVVDEDIEALWAWLQTVSPSDYEPPDNELYFPFGIRAGLAAWQTLYFEPGRFEPHSDRSDEWNRGAYLVEGLGHCGACHTPKNIAEAPVEEQQYGGAAVDRWYAPNLTDTSASGIAEWSVDELAAWLSGAEDAPSEAAAGPMAEVVHESLASTPKAHVRAMAVYLKNPPVETEAPAPEEEPAVVAEDQLALGEALYRDNCLTCHGRDGRGVEGAAPTLVGNSSVVAPEPYNAVRAVLQGFEPRQTWPAMPSFAGVLSDAEIAAVVDYTRVEWGNNAEPDTSAWLVATLRDQADLPEAGAATDATTTLICPEFQDYELAQETQQALGEVAQDDLTQQELEKVVDSYQGNHPEATDGEAIGALIAGYCPHVASREELSYSEKGARMTRFVNKVAPMLVRGGGSSG